MIAFETYLNKRKIATAGLDLGVVSLVLTYHKRLNLDNNLIEETIDLHIGGLDSKDKCFYTWINESVKVNDEMVIKIVDTAVVDKPSKSFEGTLEEIEIKEKLKQFNKLKEELKDYLKE